MRVLLVVAVLLAGGCVEPAGTARESDGLGWGPVAPTAYDLVCPPGGTTVDGVCAYRIASLTESNQEPFVAVHPTDPDVVAVGVNAGHTTGAASTQGGGPGVDLVRLDVFVTTDGGASWTRSSLPYVRDPDVTLEPVETIDVSVGIPCSSV